MSNRFPLFFRVKMILTDLRRLSSVYRKVDVGLGGLAGEDVEWRVYGDFEVSSLCGVPFVDSVYRKSTKGTPQSEDTSKSP
jgi:hypothetical protein